MAIINIGDDDGLSTSGLFQLLLITSFVVDSIGFYKLVWFISIGYGYSVAAMAVVLGFVLWQVHSTIGNVQDVAMLSAQLVLLFVYGIRLGTHVMRREYNAAYQKAAKENYGDKSKASLFAKFIVWISVAPLYVSMVSPAAFYLLKVTTSAEKDTASPLFVPAGLVIMAFGLFIEGLADRQKTAAKAINPNRFCDKQLYSWVRCPNYFGECLFWIGNWIVAISCYEIWWHWALSLFGLSCIISIMLGSTKRLEANQMKRYGKQKEFVEYTRTVPILLPFVPVYSLQKVKYTLG